MARRLRCRRRRGCGNWRIEGRALPRWDQCDRNLIQRDKHMAHNSDQHRVSFEVDMPVTLAQALEDDATKAGLSLDDFLCKVLSEQLKRYDEQ